MNNLKVKLKISKHSSTDVYICTGIHELKKITSLEIIVKVQKDDILEDSQSILNRWEIEFCMSSNVHVFNDARQTEIRIA
jgi:hypothetical protein